MMPIAWHPKRWWNFCLLEGEKKEIEPIFTVELWKCVLVVCNMGILKQFGTENCVWFFWSNYLNQFSIKIIHKDLIQVKMFQYAHTVYYWSSTLKIPVVSQKRISFFHWSFLETSMIQLVSVFIQKLTHILL